MSLFRKLTQTIWHCQYHIVWVTGSGRKGTVLIRKRQENPIFTKRAGHVMIAPGFPNKERRCDVRQDRQRVVATEAGAEVSPSGSPGLEATGVDFFIRSSDLWLPGRDIGAEGFCSLPAG